MFVMIMALLLSGVFDRVSCVAACHRPSRVLPADVHSHLSELLQSAVLTREFDALIAEPSTPIFHIPLHQTKASLLRHAWIHCQRVSQLMCNLRDLKPMTDKRYRTIKNPRIFVCHTTDFIAQFYRPISAINLAVELGSNFAEKIGR